MKHNIIAGIVIILAVTCFAMYNILTQEEPLEYFSVVGMKSEDHMLIEEFRILKNMVKNNQLKDDISSSITFEKEKILERFNEDYFLTKKLGLVVVYEDNAKDFEYHIDKVTYNENKTEATIYYTYKIGTYSETFASTWHNYMFVELESTVEDVKFVLDNRDKEK